jgi:hypothetical protein
MSDYLSSLAARSLRREPACEPRRAQMFEPRQETPDSALARGAHEGLAGAENASGAPAVYESDGGALSEPRAEGDRPRPDFHTAQSPLRMPAPPSRTSHTRAGEDVPPSSEHTPHDARPVEAARQTKAPSPSTTNAATEAAGEPPSLNTRRDVKATPHTPSAHAHPTSSRQARATSEERAESLRPESSERAPLAGALDEEGGEQAPAVERRVADESKGSTAAVDIEVIRRASKPPQYNSDSESPSKGVLQPLNPAASAEALPFTEVRPVTAQPSAPREESTQPPPTIEVTIGRIEVRAVTPPAPPPRQRHEPPRMSLDDYLRARDGGRS